MEAEAQTPATESLDQLAETPRCKDHPGAQKLLGYFAWDHLPPHLREVSQPFGELAVLREVSQPFGELAVAMAERLPANAESATMLRKLLEAKDCAVRSLV